MEEKSGTSKSETGAMKHERVGKFTICKVAYAMRNECAEDRCAHTVQSPCGAATSNILRDIGNRKPRLTFVAHIEASYIANPHDVPTASTPGHRARVFVWQRCHHIIPALGPSGCS